MSNCRHVVSMASTGAVILGGPWAVGCRWKAWCPGALRLACPPMVAAMMCRSWATVDAMAPAVRVGS